MAVFTVSVLYKPNGNGRSRPIVADAAEQARQIAEAEWDIAENDPDFEWLVEARPDLDGNYERLLLDGERRRLEAEHYR